MIGKSCYRTDTIKTVSLKGDVSRERSQIPVTMRYKDEVETSLGGTDAD